jgi:N-acetylmuramic acid 6-phosphate etherase
MLDIEKIITEQRNESTAHIDELSTLDMVSLMNNEDKKVAYAVAEALEPIACAIDLITEKLQAEGRLIYCGCGTSGRLGILDAVECPPTYSTEPEMVQGIIAGGYPAVFKAVEGAEDDYEQGKKDLMVIGFTNKDILVGIAASGRTPYVIGAMTYAKSIGAPVVSVTCCPGSQMGRIADIDIAPSPGPEVVTGSTRMKSGTAQKMILNMLSTGSMIKLGKVYGNLMVDVKPSNEKLIQRGISIVCNSVHVSEATAREVLEQCSYNPKTAIVMLVCKLDSDSAKDLLAKAQGKIASAVQLHKQA